ncbi:hypothetical protein PVL29_009884 [Vitis rotundifolia]|uniref:DNA N(6)-methyladenine demethylase n=1 Tax=Vitis rotundifolia TaxID=103349 RepID=A0AA38ZSG9_VITRO|nr:hypothetical protein PVL29_009884 [Vitis rotundifolia]
MLSRTTSVAAISHRLHQIFPQFSSYLPKMNSVDGSMERVSPPICSDSARSFAMVARSGSKEPVSSSDSSYADEFPTLSADVNFSYKNRKSNKMRTRVDLSTEVGTRENSSLHHESPPMSNSTFQQYGTSLPSDCQEKGTPSYSRELHHVQSCVDDEVSSTNAKQDDSKLPNSLGKKSMPPHLRQRENEDSTRKDESDYSYLPTQFGKKSTPPQSRKPQRGQPYHRHDVGIGNSECPRGLQKFEPFDICKSGVMHPVNLNSPLHVSNRDKQNEIKHSMEGTTQEVLRPGMVLLKGHISLTEQIKMVKKCRDLGVGPGGFYRPGYQDGAKLRLQMMCLGMNWDPQTRKYEKRHPLDGSEPPDIPQEFSVLVERAIQDSQSLIKKNSGENNVEDMLPRMSPNICIVNFYTTSGRLGLHQDRDESEESLLKRLPVVSFSLGDSAEFLYGDQRNVDAARRVVLESGDVLIFGGPSRHIFHGVSSIIPNSAPNSLLEETNLLPGRLNLTLRQF